MASPRDTLVIKDNYVYVNDARADDLITEYSGIAGVKINLKTICKDAEPYKSRR